MTYDNSLLRGLGNFVGPTFCVVDPVSYWCRCFGLFGCSWLVDDRSCCWCVSELFVLRIFLMFFWLFATIWPTCLVLY